MLGDCKTPARRSYWQNRRKVMLIRAPQTNTATAQDNKSCTLALAAAPVINDLRLGMTSKDVLALFPGSESDTEVRGMLSRPPSEFGLSELLMRPAKYASKEKFAGVSQ